MQWKSNPSAESSGKSDFGEPEKDEMRFEDGDV
jgi:hypothetical protein